MVGEPFLSFESLRTNGQPRLCDGVGGREWWFGGGENRCDMVGEPFLSFESLRMNGRTRPRLCNGLGAREWWVGGGGKQV